MQVGRFSRPFFDYTTAAVRLDLGLTSPQAQWLADGGGPAAGGSIASLGARSSADDWLDSGAGELQATGPLLKHRCALAGCHDSQHEFKMAAGQTLSNKSAPGSQKGRQDMQQGMCLLEGAPTTDALLWNMDEGELHLPSHSRKACAQQPVVMYWPFERTLSKSACLAPC